MKRWRASIGLALFLGTATWTQAAGLIVIVDPNGPGENTIQRLPGPPPPWPRPPLPPHLPPERPFAFAPLEVVSLKIQARVSDQFAKTTVDEEFYNPNARALEGTFLFPVPKGAHLDKFTMEIGGQSVEAELLDADKARKLYEDIVRKAKDPALLEYAGRDLLKARIFPIEPHSRKRVSLSYSQLLKLDSGLVSYLFPMDAGKFSAKPLQNVSLKLELECKHPLKSIYSPSHTVEIRRHGPSQATVGFEARNTRPEGDFQLLFAAEDDELGFNFLAHRTGSDDGYFVLLASPGFASKRGKVLAKDVAFVLDTSGSMAGAKLEQAKKALLFCVENLNDNDRFEVIRFATETEPLFGQLTASSSDNRSRARQFIQNLKPIGGTAIDEALHKALELRPSQSERPYVIVFLTDGRPTVGTTDEDRIAANVSSRPDAGKTGTRVFCFGIGTDVNTHLLDKISEQTQAFSQYVLPEEDIEVKVSNFFSKIKEPVLANLKLRTDDHGRIGKLSPADLPDLFQGEQLVVVGRYSQVGDSSFTLEGAAEGETKRFRYPVHFPENNTDNDFIPRLWATRRVGYLLDQIRLHGEDQELRQEVTGLARQYGIVTPYTAHLILEDETRRGVPMNVQSLPQLQRDEQAQTVARQFYNSANRDRSGQTAVAMSRYGLALKQADNAQSLALSAPEAQLGLATTAPVPTSASPTGTLSARTATTSAGRLAEYTQQSRFVNGRNFFLNGSQWVDANVQSQAKAPRVKILFGSPDYFELVRTHPEAGSWVALGQNVQFALDGKIYDIAAAP